MGGINNVLDVHELEDPRDPEQVFLRDALNVDVDKKGKYYRRGGYDLLTAGNAHSAFSHPRWPWAVAIIGGVLKKVSVVDGALVLTTLATVDATALASYTVQNEYLYFSNGRAAFKLNLAGDVLAWGVIDPPGQPTLTATANGGFRAGKYMVAVTFLSAAGEESGTGEAVEVVLTENQGITLSSIPQPPDSTYRVRIYCTGQNGDALYTMDTIPFGVSSYFLLGVLTPGKMLETQFMQRVPPSAIIRAYKGRIYFVIGKTIYYTQALRYGLSKPHEDYIRFASNVTMLEAVDDGLYVGVEDRIVFLPGEDPKKMIQRTVSDDGAVPGTGLVLNTNDFNLSTAPVGLVAVWWSTGGDVMRGLSGGVVTSLTADRLSLPTFTRGTTLYREFRGMKQLMSVMSDPTTEGFVARDSIVSEIVRNGVVVSD